MIKNLKKKAQTFMKMKVMTLKTAKKVKLAMNLRRKITNTNIKKGGAKIQETKPENINTKRALI